MTRIVTTWAVSTAFLFVLSFTCWLIGFAKLSFWWNCGIGAGILVAGIVALFTLAQFAMKTVKLTVTFTNGVAMGFFLRCWYINRGFENPLWLMLCVGLFASVYFVIFVLPLLIPAVNRGYTWYWVVFFAVSVVGYILLAVLTRTTWVFTLGYFDLLQLGFILSLSLDGEQTNGFWVSSYSVMLCAMIVFVLAVCGDNCECCCDGFDGFGTVKSPLDVNKKTQSSPLNKI